MNSDAPLDAALPSILISNLNFVNLKRLVFFFIKYTTGIAPPTSSLIEVASAAPTSPHLNPATKSASSAILVTPAATVTYRPSLGFPAVANRH